MQTYEIRRSGQVICRSSIPDCGYPKEILRDMERNGMHLYCDGERGNRRRGRLQGAERVAGVGGQRSCADSKAHTGHPNRQVKSRSGRSRTGSGSAGV